jgi:CheY-like chemotaxis protein
MNSTALPAPRPAFLIVDDEPLARMELAERVRDCGFDVIEAGNTADALALLDARGENFAGLVTDINMPGNRSGVVLANHVRFIWPHIVIIVVSAARTPIQGELPEHVAFLSKPVDPDALRAAISAFPAG